MMMWHPRCFPLGPNRTAAAASDQFPENVLPDNFVIFIDVPLLVSPLFHVKRRNDISMEIELFYHSPSFIHLNGLSSSSPETHFSFEYIVLRLSYDVARII